MQTRNRTSPCSFYWLATDTRHGSFAIGLFGVTKRTKTKQRCKKRWSAPGQWSNGDATIALRERNLRTFERMRREEIERAAVAIRELLDRAPKW